MKKVLVLVLVSLFIGSGVVFAEPIDLGITEWNLPDAKPGVIISLKNEGVEASLTTTLIEYKNKYVDLNLDVGAAPTINEPLAGLTFKFGDLSKYGVNFPLRKYLDIRVGAYCGYEINSYQNDINKDWEDAIDYGFLIQAAKIQF